LENETPSFPSFVDWHLRRGPSARLAREDLRSKARSHQMPNEHPCAGSPECLLDRHVRTQLLDRSMQARARRAHRAPRDSRHFVRWHVEIEKEDYHQTVVMTEMRYRAPEVGAAQRFLFRRRDRDFFGHADADFDDPLLAPRVAAL